jgi:putative FmdB family regulatory protein
MRLDVPLYEYQCIPNGHRFEVRQGINDSPVQICPECGSPVRRVIQPVGIVFKGSGFYVNDSRKSNPASSPVSKSSDAAAPANGSPAETKSDTGSTTTTDSAPTGPKETPKAS